PGRDAGLCRASHAGRPVDYRRLHSRAAAEPARESLGCAGERAAAVDGDATMTARLEAIRNRAFVIGVIGVVLCIAGAFFNPQQFVRSYLVAYLFWLGMPLGSLAILMLHHLVGGRWGFIIQRMLEAAVRTFPAMAVLFLPVII